MPAAIEQEDDVNGQQPEQESGLQITLPGRNGQCQRYCKENCSAAFTS